MRIGLLLGTASAVGLGFWLAFRDRTAALGLSPRDCRRYIGPKPRTAWRSTRAVAHEIVEAAGESDFDALDPGSQALHDTFCKGLELRGRCPASSPRGWYKALELALGMDGRRSFVGLTSRPAWRAFAEAYKEETGRTLPVPASVSLVEEWQTMFDRCLDEAPAPF